MADASVSSASALTTLLNSWESNWAGTVPSGKTASDQRSVEVAAGSHGNVTLDQVFPQRVTIQGASESHTTIFGVTIVRGTNIFLDLIRVSAYTNGAVQFDGCNACGITRSEIFGKTSATLADPIGLGYGVHVKNGADGVLVEECHISGFKFGSANWGGNDITYRYNFHGKVGSMSHQTSSTPTNVLFEYEGHSGDYLPDVGAHGDFLQLRSGNGITVRYNVMRKSSATGSIMRGVAVGDGGLDAYNILITQNLIVSNQIQGAGAGADDTEPGDIRTNINIINNTFLYPEDDPQNTGGIGRQFLCKVLNNGAGAGSSSSGNAQTVADGTAADSGGIVFEVGPDSTATDYSDYDDHYDSRPALGCSIASLIPKTSSAMHPDTGTGGCYDLLSELLAGNTLAAKHSTVADPWLAEFGSLTPASPPLISGLTINLASA